DEQADRGQHGGERDHRESPSRQCDAEDGRKVIGRPGQDGGRAAPRRPGPVLNLCIGPLIFRVSHRYAYSVPITAAWHTGHRKATGTDTAIRTKIHMISIVDDDESVREATGGFVRSLGYAVAAFASAEEFLSSDTVQATSCLIA